MLDGNEYKDSLVAFIDILGFDNRVRSLSQDDSFFELSKLLAAIKETADNISNADGIFSGYKFTTVSDSVIVTVPFTDPICTYGMLVILHNMQYELLATSFKTMVRGYITRGKVFHKDGYLFGPGYSEAYKGESTYIGSSPRIVLDPAIVRDAERSISTETSLEGMKTIFEFLKQDNDGFHFIDFLKRTGSQTEMSEKQYFSERESIHKFVQEGLIKHTSNLTIWAKYQWLQKYLDQTKS